MGAIIALNLCAIVLFGFIGAVFMSRRYESELLGFLAFVWWGLGLSILGWLAFVISHFISKYW